MDRNSSRATSGQALFLLALPTLAVLGAVLMSPLLPRMEAEFSQTPQVELFVPLLLTAPALCQAILSPAAGSLVDRVGGRAVILVSMLLYGVAGTAPFYLHSLTAVLGSRLLVGVAEAGLLTGSTALLGLCFDNDAAQKWFAMQSLAMPLLVSLIVAATSPLGDYNWRWTFAVYSASILFLPVAWLLVPRVRAEPGATARSGWPPPRTCLLIASIAVPGSIFFYIGPVQVAYLLMHRGFPQPSTASLVTAIGLLAGPPVVLLTRLMRRVPVARVIALAMGLMAAGMLILAAGRTSTVITIGLIIQQGGGAMMFATALAYTVSIATPQTQGGHSGAFFFIYMLAQFATPFVIAGAVALIGDRITSLLFWAMLAAVTAVFMALSRPLQRPLIVQ